MYIRAAKKQEVVLFARIFTLDRPMQKGSAKKRHSCVKLVLSSISTGIVICATTRQEHMAQNGTDILMKQIDKCLCLFVAANYL